MPSSFFTKIDAPLKILLFVGMLTTFVFGFFSWKENISVKEELQTIKQQSVENIPPVGEMFEGSSQPTVTAGQVVEKCGEDCEEKIRVEVEEAVAELSLELKATSSKQVVQSTPKPQAKTTQVFYVPVGSSGSTTKTDWADLSNTDFFFNSGEYGTLKDAKWSLNIKIFQNGQAFARLFDVTHGVAVPGSEISTTSYSYSLVESDSLKFLQGKNVYRVQMKSLTGYEASFDSGKIKIFSEQ